VEEIVKKSKQVFYSAGKDFKAKVLMKLISKNGKERIRELTMLRLNLGDSGEQKYYMYFHRPADVRQMTFMVWKYPEKNDDRWLYVPSIKLVRRIAANDKNSSFVGSDFTYEDEETFLPLKEEYYDKRGNLSKRFTADKIESIQGKATIMQRSMTNVRNGHRTLVIFDKVNYNVGLKEDIFSERYLRNAPREWIQ
jgi:hypothetical protein